MAETCKWVGPLELRSAGEHHSKATPICYVYEVFDTSDRLVYVGIARDFRARWRQHERHSLWLDEVVLGRVNVYGYLSRWEARQQEAAAINERHPMYNTRMEPEAYAAYLDLRTDPGRPLDDMDCISVYWAVYEPKGWAF